MNKIVVFEHQELKVGDGNFSANQLKSLQEYHSKFNYEAKAYYSLVNNGVKFKHFVGALQIGKLLIEVLPKIDNNNEEENIWQKRLIGMLKASGLIDVRANNYSDLKLHHNSILHLYFEIFISEVEYLLHTGLVKKYRKEEGNTLALKGRLLFNKNIQQNLIHKERFYTSHAVYDNQHVFNSILYKTLKVINDINISSPLQSRIGALLLNFPEMPSINVSEQTFDRLVFDRKTESYRKAINVSKLIILNYHPDISKGSNDVLALMFDMNKVWEKFVFKSLQRSLSFSKGYVKEQRPRNFWTCENNKKIIKADIIIQDDLKRKFVIDVKWKNIGDDYSNNISDADLKQMYVYSHYYDAQKVALVYPSNNVNNFKKGNFVNPDGNVDRECNLFSLQIEKDIKSWQKNIYEFIRDNFNIVVS